MATYKKVFLFILDGFGLAPREPGNAILAAGMPYMESLLARYSSMALSASGLVVGLPWGQSGNSEVGHSAIGTGRILVQDLAHINGEIRLGGFFENAALREAVLHAKNNQGTLHLIGCTSPGGIHSHVEHLIALLDLASRARLKKVAVHMITDGQDMPPQDAVKVLAHLQPFLKKANARIASVQGRGYAMDRVENWALTEKVWHSIVLGDAQAIENVDDYIKASYAKGVTDYGIEPATVMEAGRPIGAVQDGDAAIFYDFRNDRARQLAAPFIQGGNFKSFDLIRLTNNVKVVTMTKYDEKFSVPVAYPPVTLPNSLGEIIALQGWKQWRIAEKEKEAHVTNFFNGSRLTPFDGEQREIVSSRMMHGSEYLEHPEMSVGSIVASVKSRSNDDAAFYLINVANPDMIAHAGNLAAAIRALQYTDDALKEMIEPLITQGDCAVLITADHGNAEELIDPLTGGEDTQHSTRNVPLFLIAKEFEGTANTDAHGLEVLAGIQPAGTLVDVAPTVLKLLGLSVPGEMTGQALV